MGYWANHSDEEGGSVTAHCVHVGGLIAGLLIGVCVGRNIDEEKWEKRVQLCCWIVGILLCVASMVWWFANPFPAIRNLWDPSMRPWCWIGTACIGQDGAPCPLGVAAQDPGGFLKTFQQCVFCNTRECVEGWFADTYVGPSTRTEYKYCPKFEVWDTCKDEFTSDWDKFW